MTNQATYRAAVVKAPGQLELVERPIPAPTQGRCAFVSKPAAYAIPTAQPWSAKRRTARRRAYRGMKSSAESTRWAKGCPAGGSASGSVWAFSPARIARAGRAATATS